MKGKDLHGSNDIVSLMTEFFSITTQNYKKYWAVLPFEI